MGYPYVTRGSVNYEMSKVKKALWSALPSPTAIPSPTSELLVAGTTSSPDEDDNDEPPPLIGGYTQSENRNPGGRAKGTTKEAARKKIEKIANATETASKRFKKEKDNAKLRNRPCANGTLPSIIEAVEREYELPAGTLKRDTISRRVHRKNVTGESESRTSPLSELEPILVEYCMRLAKIGQPLTKDQLTSLAISMIEGTSIEAKVKAWKRKFSQFNEYQELIGDGWYQGFLARNADVLYRVQARMKDINRVAWVTYANFEKMYEKVYQGMIDAKVAVRLPEPVWFNREGEIVDNEEDSFGLKSDIHIIHPEYIVFVDETGVNTNQKDDGNLGGERFIVPTDDPDARMVGSTTDMHFTVLCFQSGNGEPILCAVVMKSEKHAKDIPLNWKFGIDITERLIDPEKGDGTLFIENSAAMKGGPTCTFRGKEIPCFVGTSPKASITSQLLADMLGHMDKMNIWERTADGPTPFLLLDGHHSRMELPFLDYIMDAAHEWVVCIGVPYGTHIWQVADASECNGTFKMYITRAKRVIFNLRPHGKKQFMATDVIPLINKSFWGSYGNVTSAKKAIANRGWFPANYALLTVPAIAKTKIIDNSIPVPDATVLNLSRGAAGTMTDKLLMDELRKAGRKEKLRKEREDTDEQHDILGRLKNLSRVTSGGLASLEHYSLDTNVHQVVKERAITGEEQDKERDINRAVAAVAADMRKQAAEEALQGGGKLTMDNLRALILSRKRRDDSPMKTTRAELELQWSRRHLREQAPDQVGEARELSFI
jgi:hypothetical protein